MLGSPEPSRTMSMEEQEQSALVLEFSAEAAGAEEEEEVARDIDFGEFVATQEDLEAFLQVHRSQGDVDHEQDGDICKFLVRRSSHSVYHSRTTDCLALLGKDNGLRHAKSRFQIASDLHIELLCNAANMREEQIEEIVNAMIIPSAPYLILAGDIGSLGNVWTRRQYRRFLEKQASLFELVLVVAGNHEYYTDYSGFGVSTTALMIHESIRNICKEFQNVIFLDRKVAIVDGIRVIGATLWSEIARDQEEYIKTYMNDYRRIYVPRGSSIINSPRNLEVRDTQLWHQMDRKFLEWQLRIAEREDQPVLIISHHSPLSRKYSEIDEDHCLMSSAFSTDLESLIDKYKHRLKAWVFGHTHHCLDMNFNGVRIVSNQRGYHYEKNEGYKDDFVILL